MHGVAQHSVAGRCAGADRSITPRRQAIRVRGSRAAPALFQPSSALPGSDCSFCNRIPVMRKGAVGQGRHGAAQAVRAGRAYMELNFNAGWMPDRCTGWPRNPYRRTRRTWRLFSEDRAACLLPLPGKRFDVVTWRHVKADRYGVVARGTASLFRRTGGERGQRGDRLGLARSRSKVLGDVGEASGRPIPQAKAARPFSQTARTRPCSWRCCATSPRPAQQPGT